MSESTTVLRTPLDDAHEQLADPIPAPDTGTDEQTLPWMMDTYSANKGHTVLGVVTGKPISLGGSVGRASATSRGVVDIALVALEHQGVSPTGATAAVQGFGKVGRGASRFRAESGVRVTAVSAQYGAISSGNGIDVAAVEGVLHRDNAACVKARIIVEGANGPTTPEADRILASRDILVVPDILANAGGVIVAYAAEHQLTLRTAATCLAVRRVAEAHLRRGLYP